jgi:5-methylthioadenosine/S-adenosylhomocysteine deaminase
VLDVARLHNLPAFARDPDGIYARIVYAAKSTDVVDVMCNGRWLMRDRVLQTVDERELVREAIATAARIDTFLGSREVSVLQKLVAVGGAVEQESFEVQVKARIGDEPRVLETITGPELTVIRASRYRQHDIYWSFDDPDQGRLRHRDDEFLDDAGAVTGERSRLTLTGRTREDRFGEVLLFRSRYLAPAAHSARFYREYFRPAAEHVVTKERRRWLVAYRGVEFYVHLDRLIEPAIGSYFLEIKSRTWSQRDARDKAAVIAELLALFDATPDETLGDGYVELARKGGQSPRKGGQSPM